MFPQDLLILESGTAEACFRLGIKFMENSRYAEAEICFRRTLSLAPTSLETVLNLGYALDKQGRCAEAFACYESVLATAPDNAQARYNRAAHLLRTGDFINGFADYDIRLSAMKSADPRDYPQPRWDGSPLNGRTILVYCEQCLGDAIQFARYIPLLAEKGGRVILETQQPLLSLLASLTGVEKVVLKSETPPLTDFHIPLLSLPHLFGTKLSTVPADIPYLFPPSDMVGYWQAKLGESQGVFRIGLVWTGKATSDPNRSCPPDYLEPLVDIGGTSFYSLQFGETDRLPLSMEMAGNVIDLSDDLGDFAKTAALIANLDLVITVDTVIAHLAGAIGKPVWVMLPFASDWRWLSNRTDSPWYPFMRLFRQPKAEDWQSVVREIVQMLLKEFPQTNQEADDEIFESRFQSALFDLEHDAPDSAIRKLKYIALRLPGNPAVWFNLGQAYDMAGQFVEAEQAYRQALSDNPCSPAIWCALGELRLKQSAYQEAEFCLRKAYGFKSDSVEILFRLGRAFLAQNKKTEAFDCCKKILDINPDCSEATYNMASLQLRKGNYKSGFANFEARLAIEKFGIDSRNYQQPRWDGSLLNGKSILIYGEQGMGDVIQFARYIPLVAERGGKVVFEIDPPLIPLFESFPGIDRIIPKSNEPPPTDVYIQLLSLPYIFGTTVDTVPLPIPYIIPDMTKVIKWREFLGNNSSFKIGLVWRGNAKNPRDKERSCALITFAPLAGLPNVDFYSLQVGPAAAEAASAPEGMNLKDLSGRLTDFTETAALISNLDLLISVDTAVAHLAGAMGQQVWVVLPEGSEWRWLEGRGDTPWYPTMRVFEHVHDGGWEEVLKQVRSALEVWLSEKTNFPGLKDLETIYENGVRLKEAGDLSGAESCFRQITEHDSDLPDPHHSLGVVLQLQNKMQEAIKHYRKAITLDPAFVKAHYNLANALLVCGLYQEALEAVRAVLRLDPEYANSRWLLGMLLLQDGDFLNGWKEYEWRWRATEFKTRFPDLGVPQWDGSPLAGRTLLIHMEQGRGDMIQFIRYAPLVAAMGGKIVVCVVEEMVALMATVEGISQVVDRNGPLPGYDLHIPVLSLPHVLGTTLETIPGQVPYLRPDPRKEEIWRKMLAKDVKFRVGLVWQGSPAHRDDHNRSCDLDLFLPLGQLQGITFYNLQFGNNVDRLLALADQLPIVDYSDQIHDFSDTAALVANLDLVISVDTAVAHLAGALGKPVLTLLPFVSDWRWLLKREDSPWYPTMRLFRQSSCGDWQRVVARVQQELAQLIKPANYNELGIDRLKSRQAVEAERAFKMAVTLNPNDAEAHCNLGVALDAMKRYEEAIDCYRLALLHKPGFLQALFNMGNSYMSLAKQVEARTCYEEAIQLQPGFVPAYICLGELEKQQGAFDQSQTNFEAALSLDPGCADAWQGVAELHQAREEFQQAIVAYKKVLSLDAERTSTWNLLGTVFQSLEQLDEAEACYRQALSLLPDNVIVLNNLGVVLNAQGRLEDAIAIYRHLLQVDSSYPEGHWNLSVALLAAGYYLEGWQEYEWRFRKTNPVLMRDFQQPVWDGSDMYGKTILLHAEQGFGDTIQFARYARLVAQRGGRVILECQVPALKRLIHSLEGVDEIVVAGEPLPPFDCHLPMMSLPLMFGTTLETIPANIPYLAAEPVDVEVWQQRLGPATAFRVGLVWFAKQSQVLNRKRSCRLELFASLLAVPGVEFFSLQIGLGAEQLAECGADISIKDLTSHITDFADTAGFIANLDLVITIDTAVAHLAGALGARTWVILPHVAEWRWLFQREDSPWYPTMRLFRQPLQGDWPSLMDNVAAALRDCVKGVGVKRDINIGPPRLRVGLAWAGRQDNPINCKRSCPLSALGPLFELENIIFVKLQLDSTDGQNERMIDMTGQIRDFEDTAALMANLDLIISIDTSVAHLAAATGRPTWVLLAHVADWRWAAGQANGAWYTGVELFRQPDFGDWDGVVREVIERLCQLSDNLNQKPPSVRPELPPSASSERIRLELLLENMQNEVKHNDASANAHLNVGASLSILGRDTCAIKAFRRVLEIDPEHVSGHLNLAYSLLVTGKYSEGWEHFEWRLKMLSSDMLPPWPMLYKCALGTHSHGTAVLVHCEQGYGDTILFSRFLSLLAEAGYCVIVSCQPSMAALVASVSGVSRVIPHGEPLPVCDLQVLLLSLPYLFSVTQETLPVNIPYLVPRKPKVMDWKIKLNEKIRQHDFFSKEFLSFDDMGL